MVKHIWTVLCSSSSIDRASNTISLFNVVEQLTASELPIEWPVVIPLPLQIVTLWARLNPDEPAMAEAQLTLEKPNESKPLGPPYIINLTEHHRHRQIAQMGGIKLEGPESLGLWWFVVQIKDQENWKEVARVSLEVSYESLQPTKG